MCTIALGQLTCAQTHFTLFAFLFAAVTALALFATQLRIHTTNLRTFIPLLALATLFSAEAMARAGGGSSGKCGLICIILFPIFLLYALYVSYRIDQKNKAVKAALADIAKREPQWSEENLLTMAAQQFRMLQVAWGNRDLDTLKAHLHPQLYPEWEMQIKDQSSRGERNVMAGLSINNMRIVDVQNYADDERDEFTVCFDASADDQTIRDGQVVKSDKSSFREFWTFEWEKGRWALREVTQAKGWKRFVSAPIIDQLSSRRRSS